MRRYGGVRTATEIVLLVVYSTMSPALQGNLEVERYIGSYLISQRVPPNVKSTKRYQNQHPKQKNTEVEKVPRTYNKYCFPPREHHVGGPPRYPMPPLPVDYNHQYKHNPGGSGWAGVPLISMTSGNHRRNKKVPSTTNPNQMQKFPNKQAQQNCYVKGKDIDESSQIDSDRSPLTRLAIHTQGAPLIQAGRFGNNNNRCRNNFSRDQTTRVYRGEGVRWETTKDAKTAVIKEGKDQPCGNTDSSSVASDESSANSENSLPRIIKPRKRRKKDRKPITGNTSVTSSSPNSDSPQYSRQPEHNVEPSTLKAYLPLCFEHEVVDSGEHITCDLLSDNSRISSYEDKQNEDLIDPLTSADEFPLGNLLDDEDDKSSEPATLCQCRYCDPSGVIWDVDQRCYSPFLTPPSPTDAKMPFSNPLMVPFDSFRPYNRQMAVLESSPPSPPSQFSFGGDLASLLRRSWSDPSPYKKHDFQSPILECGRERRDSRPPSAGLQVSSEIVTSPNGHRDIEIKFYSSSVPLDASKVKFGVGDRDQSDGCFLVEE